MNRRTWTIVDCGGPAREPFSGGLQPPASRPPPPPVPEVAVVTVQPQQVVLTTELPGRTSGYLVAEIRPQVNGLIQKRLFTEGSDVKAGQVLYQIDPAPFQAALRQCHGEPRCRAEGGRPGAGRVGREQRRPQAAAGDAEARQDEPPAVREPVQGPRPSPPCERDQAVTDVDVAEATLRAAEAQVESDREAVAAAEAAIKQAEAAVETARINLGYTKITAPISGRIGRSNVTEGAIVTAYQPVALATIQQLDPIYVDVPQSTAELNRLKRSLANGRLKDERNRQGQDRPGRRHGLSAGRVAQVPRRDGGPDDRLGHPADRRSQSRRRFSCPACSSGRSSRKASTSRRSSFPSRPSRAIPRAIPSP